MDDRANGAQRPQFPALPPQGSFCNISFDDVQPQFGNIGKTLNTMNFDELLKNVISVEESNKLGHNQNTTSSSASSSISLFPGETTLEEFLARAGVINPPQQPVVVNDPINVMVPEQADWLQFQMGGVQQEEQHQITIRDSNSHFTESIYGNPAGNVGVGYSENHQLAMPMTAMSVTSPDPPAAEKKCRYSDEVKEKSIERRQRRMIKNRESAARSRARKQVNTLILLT